MKKKKEVKPHPKRGLQVAIIIGVAIIAVVILVNYNLDQANLSGQRFGDSLSAIQSDLKNETIGFDANLTMYEKGQISKEQMLNITDAHIAKMQTIIPRYDALSPPEPFSASLQLFRLSTQTQIESDNLLKEWIQTGDNSTRAKSDQLLQQSFQYEMSALQSFHNAKSGNS
ncbi:MAG: hypothetical protein KGH89_05430 [Thaumarchaeota archaeon]|nr:hypothetical protein [Nitrososphaerota archaeon]MDE1868241.1 hypothetical protein [Nitrososphaerota archaeon]